MKKVYYLPIVIIVFLVITNPSLKDFKEYMGITTAKLESMIILSRTHNYFICSSYSAGGNEINYFGIGGNFFILKSDKQKSNERLEKFYNLLSAKNELGTFDDFKEHLKDRIYRVDIYKQSMEMNYIESFGDFEKDIIAVTN